VRLRGTREARAALYAGVLGFAVGGLLLAVPGVRPGAGADGTASAPWKQVFARPTFVPHPPDNPPTPEKLALGERLFKDKSLSINGKVACASCHDPALAFTDGVARGQGVTGQKLRRNTPALWNLAWAPLLYWDGRAGSLEDQARFPLEQHDEMGERVDRVAERLGSNESYRVAFRQAFPESPEVTGANLLKAISTFERSLVSPATRFDRWLEGDKSALSPAELTGFKLFTGRAQCVNCHTGFAFTDRSFHDIGLPGDDLGRGDILKLNRINRGFKTPGLRELAWTAPYMHDGSLPTLEAVVDHYSGHIVDRPTLSADLNKKLRLTDEEKTALVAFLMTLSSDEPPRAMSMSVKVARIGVPDDAAVTADTIGQKDKKFRPDHVRLRVGEKLKIINDDIRTHNVRVDDPRLRLNSGAQEPGDSVELDFPAKGTFDVTCGIHPIMRLQVDVQ